MSLANAQASSSKHKEHKHKSKHGKDGKTKEHKKSKSSHKSKSAKDVDGPFEHRVQRMRLSVPPKFSADWREGVRETLDGMLMRYIPQMGGVLLAHWDHEFADDTVKIINECPFGICEITFHSIVWAPKVGQVLYGTHSLSSPSHLSLLFAKTFNVSIPLQHIPLDTFEFEHTDAPEEEEDFSSDEEDEHDGLLGSAVHEVGRWKEKGTGKVLGAGGERVGFTVIGLQVSNNMLSLSGSLLADPSNPPAITTTVVARVPSLSPDLPDPPVAVKAAASRPNKAAKSGPANSKRSPAKAAAPAAPEVDTSGMTQRELKKYHKEQEKAKRDARKARKALQDGEEVTADEPAFAAGAKRKAEDGPAGERKKMRKGGN